MTTATATDPTMSANINITSDFVFAGRATFTVANASGEHLTFRVRRSEPREGYDRPAYWAYVLTGPDNESDYTYLGRLDEAGRVSLTNASRFTADARPVRVLQWAIGVLIGRNRLPLGYTIQHDGCCGRCGRTLTTPASLETGIGPECARKLGRA